MKRSILKIMGKILEKYVNKKTFNDQSGLKKLEDQNEQFSKSFTHNISLIKSYLDKSDDIVFRTLNISTLPSLKATLVFIENLVDNKVLESSVLAPLTHGLAERSTDERAYLFKHIEAIFESVFPNMEIAKVKDSKSAVENILLGNGILITEGYPYTISFNLAKGANREYAEPMTEKVVKGPQSGFVEDISVNTAMIRKRLKSPNLVIKELKIGRESRTVVRVGYMDNIADSNIVEELFRRLEKIDVDGIVGSSEIEEYINDAPTSLFQTTFFTERPDRVQAMLLEGRVVIVCEETPFAIVVPAIISDFFISSEDYYITPFFATFNRLISYLGALIVLFLPATYIALTTYHQESIPTRLALTLAGTRAGVPYPAFVEALLMEISFEALRQAGVRLPTHVGQAVSIVGALIIGQAAVEAGLVSPAVIIVVAATAIFSFTLPYSNFSLILRLLRFVFMILAAILGIYGILAGAMLLLFNLMSLRSFGVPFMLPFAPFAFEEMKDWVIRVPHWNITKRSSHIASENLQKKASNLKPQPLKGKE